LRGRLARDLDLVKRLKELPELAASKPLVVNEERLHGWVSNGITASARHAPVRRIAA